MENKFKKLVIIDGNAVIHRAYHALPPLRTKDGELVNAVYGFASTILSVINKFKPEYIVATFDLAAPTFRHKEYKKYKATRVKVDQELYDQIPRVKEVVRAMNIPILEYEGYEADDLIGTIAKEISKNDELNSKSKSLDKTQNEQIKTIIVTGDLDTLQLVDENTKVYTMRRGINDSVMYDSQKIKERYGITPKQIIDFKGLRGDPSDNIPGVKGIGEKTAISLLKQYESVENVFRHLDEINGSVKEKLKRDKMQAIQSKHLATIVQNVPIKFNLEEARTKIFDYQKLKKLFQTLNFFSLVKRIPNDNLENKNLSADTFNNGKTVKDFKYERISEDRLKTFFEKINEQKEISFYLEIKGESILEREISGIAFSWKTGRAGYVSWNEKSIPTIKKILENRKIKKIGYDLKIGMEVFKRYGIKLEKNLYDIVLAAYVLNPGEKINFSKLVLYELNEELKEEKKGQLGLGLEAEASKERIQEICRKADYAFKLKFIYAEKIEKISQEQKDGRNLKKVLEELELPLIKVLAEMELTGVKLNPIIFKGIAEKIEIKIKKLEEAIYQLAGEKFNLNSPKQLAKILFEKLKLPVADIKKGKTNYSTALTELQKLKGENKIVEKIEEYREIFKLKTTYLDTLPLLTDKNSRVHSTFNQAVTATGRLSSSNPNLQNIPIRTDLGRLLRVAFEASSGWRFISADYSQIDLRVVAHSSGDKKMIDLFWRGEDIHRATASEINKVSLSQVTQKMRSAAKALNFGVIYGMSVFGFSQSAGVSRDEAKKFIHTYFEKFVGVAKYIKETKEKAKRDGFVETEMGRRRYIPEINSPNFQAQNAAERMAINMPIQGMSADIVKLAMIKVYETFRDNTKVKIILQVHDEIILEVQKDVVDKVSKKVKNIMEQVYKLKVPLRVNIKTGDNWGEL